MLIAIFFFTITMSGTIASVFVGAFVKDFDNIGYLLVLNTAIPAFIAAFCFFMAGPAYKKFMINKH